MVEKLTNEEIEMCREAFQKFDRDGSGAIDVFELRATLESMGQQPTDEELFDMIAEVDADGSGEIGASSVPLCVSPLASAARPDDAAHTRTPARARPVQTSPSS